VDAPQKILRIRTINLVHPNLRRVGMRVGIFGQVEDGWPLMKRWIPCQWILNDNDK
jgi:hypothetical protein